MPDPADDLWEPVQLAAVLRAIELDVHLLFDTGTSYELVSPHNISFSRLDGFEVLGVGLDAAHGVRDATMAFHRYERLALVDFIYVEDRLLRSVDLLSLTSVEGRFFRPLWRLPLSEIHQSCTAREADLVTDGMIVVLYNKADAADATRIGRLFELETHEIMHKYMNDRETSTSLPSTAFDPLDEALREELVRMASIADRAQFDPATEALADMREAAMQFLRESDPTTREMRRLLGVLSIRATLVDELRSSLAPLVSQARSRGASWADIGKAVGITAQSAHQRWRTKSQDTQGQDERSLPSIKPMELHPSSED